MELIEHVGKEAIFAFENAQTFDEMEQYRKRYVSANGQIKSALALCDDRRIGSKVYDEVQQSFCAELSRLKDENYGTH